MGYDMKGKMNDQYYKMWVVRYRGGLRNAKYRQFRGIFLCALS